MDMLYQKYHNSIFKFLLAFICFFLLSMIFVKLRYITLQNGIEKARTGLSVMDM